MLLSLTLAFLYGMSLRSSLEKMKVPRLLGMLITGILLGSFGLDLLDGSALGISKKLRQIVLIIILARTGLNLDVEGLRKVGRPAVLTCFVPTCFEIVRMVLLVPALLELTKLEVAVTGMVVVTVPPAIIVPRMLELMKEGRGKERNIPQMIVAGVSVDDVFVIMLFAVFVGLEKSGSLSAFGFLVISTSVVLGLAGGVLAGLALSVLLEKVHIEDSNKAVLMLSVAFLLVTLEHSMNGAVGFSGLLVVTAMGMALQRWKYDVPKCLSQKLSKLWAGAEILLFALVGATVNVGYAWKARAMAMILILGVLVFQMAGVFLCLAKTPLSREKRVFSAMTYLPKAMMQAAISGLPLSMELACGDIVLTMAVLSILVTALLGAVLIDCNYKKLLQKAG